MTEHSKSRLVRHQLSESGSWDYTISKVGDTFELNFGCGLRFEIAPENPIDRAVNCLEPENTVPNQLQLQDHLIQNQITPMIKAWKGAMVLHASAVTINDQCWGFVGKSGAGKSTIAKRLSASKNFNHWCDDWLEIQVSAGDIKAVYNEFTTRLGSEHAEKLVANHMIPPLSLKKESVGNKLIIGERTSQKVNTKVSLGVIYEVVPHPSFSKTKIQRLTESEAFCCLSKHLYRLDTTNKQHFRREFEQLTNLIASTPVYRLNYSHSIPGLASITDLLLENFEH